MEITKKKSVIFSSGLAMFAMFFGAGNIIFPLVLGQTAQDKNIWGILGMLLTAVIVPLLGILAMLTYEGDYNRFFNRIGKWPGFLLSGLILAVIGPFAGIPRCITISYSTLSAFGIESSPLGGLILFSLATCILIFFLTYRPRKMLALIGYILTPILLFALAVIAVKGTMVMPKATLSTATRWDSFFEGLFSGYHTMDLLAAFFFSSVVILCLKQNEKGEETLSSRLKVAGYAAMIAAFLLALVYVSFSFVAAGFSPQLQDLLPSQLLGHLAYELLGAHAGLLTGVIIAFACLTTEIALVAVFADYLHKTLFKTKLSYSTCIILTLLVAFFVSTLQFEGISKLLSPLLLLCYPALIALTVVNLAHKIYDFKPVKRIFYSIITLSILVYLFL